MAGTTQTLSGKLLGKDDFSEILKALTTTTNALVADVEVLRTALAASNTLVGALRVYALTRAFADPAFAIKSNMDVQNANAVPYIFGGTLKVLASGQTFDTGTAQVIIANKWSSALLSLNASNSPVLTWSATLNAADEATAIAALPAIPATSIAIGYITVLTGSGVTWTAGTDALQGGTGGTPATTTTYYNIDQVLTQALPAALTTTTVDAANDMTAALITTDLA